MTAFRGGKRANGSSLRRFESAVIDPSQVHDLSVDHPAVVEGRTIFPSTVVSPLASKALLVSSHNNPKLGKMVTKGPRAGWPIYQLTLEERATCPRSCAQWRSCYGSAMHMARRHAADGFLVPRLRIEVARLARAHPEGFLVRLHTLGDFFSVEYVLAWGEMLAAHPALHVFGYTARSSFDDDPLTRKIGWAVELLRDFQWERFAIRTSRETPAAKASIVVMADPELPDVIMCPAQSKDTETCGTCGLCWASGARSKTIAFLKHGMRGGRRPAAPAITAAEAPEPEEFTAAAWRPQSDAVEALRAALPALFKAHPDGATATQAMEAIEDDYARTLAAIRTLAQYGECSWGAHPDDPKRKLLGAPRTGETGDGLTPQQRRVLAALQHACARHEYLTAAELARRADVLSASITVFTDALRKKGALTVKIESNAWSSENCASVRMPDGSMAAWKPTRAAAPPKPKPQRGHSVTAALMGDPVPGRTPWSGDA